jgi:histidyl-tRNA synthetase
MNRTVTTNKKPVVAAPRQQALQGTRDILTQTSPLWSVILKRFQKIGRTYGFSRIETPIIEDESVYSSYYKDRPEALNQTLFTTVGNKTMALRSSLLPSILRSYVNYKVADTMPQSKWMYAGNTIRLDERGTPHSDYQFGFEVLGTFNHLTEAQVISAVWDFLQRLGLEDGILEINTTGDANCQATYQDVLKTFLKEKRFDLCDNCNEHLNGRVLNVLRCDNVDCQVVLGEAPAILDFLDQASNKSFTNILEALDELSLPYQLNPLYAGPEGTSQTNLVVKYKSGNSYITIGEGAYHDNLLKNLSGKGLSSFGFLGSFAALQRAMESAEVQVASEPTSEVFLVPLGELAAKKSLKLFRDLIGADIRVHDHFGTVGVKNQLKQAEEYKSPIALIMGQKEAMDDMVILRDVKSGMQEVFSYDKIIDEVRKRLGR